MYTWLSPVASAIATLLVVGAVSRWRGRGAALDHPGHRSLHVQPTPRLGGLGIATGIAAGLLLLWLERQRLLGLWLAALPLLVLSVLEDFRPLPAIVRLAAQLTVALLLLAAYVGSTFTLFPGITVELGWAGAMLGVLAVVWMTNLYNFMDGMDGLAGSMAVIGFGTLGWADWRSGADDLALQAWVVAAACAGFLPWNLPRARIFMGDGGAIPLGFLAAGLGLEAVARALVPVWFVLLLFSPFLVDATLTLLLRLGRRERVWEAHRSHYYQRLVLRCRGRHGPVLLAEAALMLTCSASGIILLNSHSVTVQWAGLAGWGAVYAFLAIVLREGHGLPQRTDARR